MNLKLEDVIPATGEWTISTAPNDFIVVLNNTTGLLQGIDRIAFMLTIGVQGTPDASGLRETDTTIHQLREVEGIYPGKEIVKTAESRQVLDMLTPGIEASLNKWSAETSDEKAEAIWAMAETGRRGVILDMIANILGGDADKPGSLDA